MATRQQIELLQVGQFTKGLNTKADPSELGLDELADCQNIEIDDKSIYQRPGSSELRTDAGTDEVAGLHEHVEADGTAYRLKVVGTKLYYDNGTTWVEVTLPGGYSITDGERWNWFDYDNVTYGCNGTDNVIAISGATPSVTEKASIPIFSMSVVFQNRVFLIEPSDNKQKIQYSDLDDPETYGGTSFVLVDPRSPDDNEVKALKVLHGQIVVFKTRSIHVYGGPDTSLVPVFTGIGALNNNCVVFDGNSSLIFADKDGIYATNLTSIVNLSEKVENRWIARNQNYDDNVVATFYKNKYRIAYTHADDTTNSRELIYDVRYGWTATKGINANFYEQTVLSNKRRLLFASPSNAKVYLMGEDPTTETDDDGAAIESYAVTALTAFNIPEIKKKIKKAYVHVDDSGNYNLSAGYRFDDDSAWAEELVSLQNESTWNYDDAGHYYDDGSVWPSGGGSVDNYFYIAAGKRRRIQFRFYMSGTDNFWRLFHLGIPLRKDRRFK